MGWWAEYRQRNEAKRAQIAERPVAAWFAHAIVFTAFAFALQRLRGGEVDWMSPVILGAAVAGGLVAGSVFAHRREQRRSQKP